MSTPRIKTPYSRSSRIFLTLFSSWVYLAPIVSAGHVQIGAFSIATSPQRHDCNVMDGFHRTFRKNALPSLGSNHFSRTRLDATRNRNSARQRDDRTSKQSQQQSLENGVNSPVVRRGKGGAGADSYLLQVHKGRLQKAGKVGTKRFLDPCKVFCGNLPFDCSEEQLRQFFQLHLSHSAQEIHTIRIVRDWKTGQSKGYAFCRFTDPIFATLAMDKCSGKELGGRPISVGQGKKKDQDQPVYVKKNKQPTPPLDEEEAAIQQGLAQAQGGGIARIHADNEVDDKDTTEWIMLDDNEDNDEYLFSDDEEFKSAGDEDFDGDFEELYPIVVEESDVNLNREQRRSSGRTKKRRKLPYKGFGERPVIEVVE